MPKTPAASEQANDTTPETPTPTDSSADTPNLAYAAVAVLPMEPLLISLKDAAAIVGLKYYGFYELVEKNIIPTSYQGRRRYVTPQALRDYVASLPTTGPDSDEDVELDESA